jgi:hypothetical protein
VAPSIIRDYFRVQPPADDAPSVRWVRFQLRAIRATAPVSGFSVNGGPEVDLIEDDSPTAGPR